MKKLLLLLSIVAIVSCKKDSLRLIDEVPSVSILGSWRFVGIDSTVNEPGGWDYHPEGTWSFTFQDDGLRKSNSGWGIIYTPYRVSGYELFLNNESTFYDFTFSGDTLKIATERHGTSNPVGLYSCYIH